MDPRRPPSCASSGAAAGGEGRELHAVAEEMDEEALREVPAGGTRMKLPCELAALRRSSPERGTALAVEAAGGDRDEEQLVTRLAAEPTATTALASDSFPKTTHR